MFGWINILQRWLFTNFLVFATYNPSGISYLHWLTAPTSNKSVVAVIGIAFLAAYVFLIRSTWRSIKITGVLIGATFFALFNVMLIDLGVFSSVDATLVTLMFLVSLSSILTIGLCFSAIRARLSGQIDSDDIGRPA